MPHYNVLLARACQSERSSANSPILFFSLAAGSLNIELPESLLVGAVGIENTAGRNFKDLEEMMGNAKSLKRTNRECQGILIGPSMAPHFCGAEIPLLFFRSIKSGVGFRSNLVARMASRRPHCSIG